jgi:hypothetical protein
MLLSIGKLSRTSPHPMAERRRCWAHVKWLRCQNDSDYASKCVCREVCYDGVRHHVDVRRLGFGAWYDSHVVRCVVFGFV